MIRCDRVVEVRIFDSLGQVVASYDIDVSTNLLSKRWGKLIWKILRECITVAMTGGAVVMRGVLTPKI